jgi:cation diffusion facilitator CzcD-associated flavoprotein CzcO
MSARRFAIIGAGWSGLQMAAVLRDCGHEVCLLERLDEVGGTWHPENAYSGLAIHTPSFRCQFHDFDGWKDKERLARLPAADVYANCRAFADQKGLRPFIRVRHRVLAIEWDTNAQAHHLTVRDEATGAHRRETFDVVVNTQFNAPRVPNWPGKETFAGAIVHSGRLRDAEVARITAERPRVVLVGGSKAACDIALVLVHAGVPFTWLMRRMYWFLSFDKGYFDAERQRPSRRFHRALYFAGLGLANGPLSTQLVFRLWHLAGLLHTPGRESPDVTAFHHGWLDCEQVRTLRERTTQVYGDIARLEGTTLRLADGRSVDADLVIAATGCNPISDPIPLSVDGRPVPYEDVEHVYRASVIPDLPRLVFTGYAMFGFGPLNGYHRAAWVLRFLEQELDPAALRRIAQADGDAPYMFRRGSVLFDGSRNLLASVKVMNRRMGEGLYTLDELKKHFRDIAIDHAYAPIAGVERFLDARRKSGAPARTGAAR